MSSPKKKKIKLVNTNENSNKRMSESVEEPSKRQRTDGMPNREDIQAKKRRNFIKACEIVSYKAYYDHHSRFQLIYLPPCAEQNACRHNDHKIATRCNKTVPSYAEESFNIEMTSNMWYEALEVCRLCITPYQHLPANILKDIVEIMMNAHDDEQAEYTTDYLIDKCQQVLELNFSYHPPCAVASLRRCYSEFLTSPMNLKAKTFTNRTEFGSDKGIIKYCFNRLEHEISLHSKDEPLVDKYEHIPEDMKQGLMGLNWQKEKFEIFELLERSERIKRLIAVLDSIIELLQCDLAIWQKRYTTNTGSHIMRSHKPLMASLLWSNNVLYTGMVNNDCRQILRLFVYMIHLQYPEDHIKTMVAWLNTVVQTFYICENNSNKDYPNTGKYSNAFANSFYKIIAEMPNETVIKVIERIKPDYMQYLVGSLHVRQLLNTQEENPIKVFTEFLKSSQWIKFPENTSKIKIFKKTTYGVRSLMRHLKKRLGYLNALTLEMDNDLYFRFDPLSMTKNSETSLNHVLHTLYVTLEAYLDAYSVQNIQETLDDLNENLQNSEVSSDLGQQMVLPDFCSYSVTEDFIRNYRSIYQLLKELMLTIQDMKNSMSLPNIFRVFEEIGLLGI